MLTSQDYDRLPSLRERPEGAEVVSVSHWQKYPGGSQSRVSYEALIVLQDGEPIGRISRHLATADRRVKDSDIVVN